MTSYSLSHIMDFSEDRPRPRTLNNVHLTTLCSFEERQHYVQQWKTLYFSSVILLNYITCVNFKKNGEKSII